MFYSSKQRIRPNRMEKKITLIAFIFISLVISSCESSPRMTSDVSSIKLSSRGESTLDTGEFRYKIESLVRYDFSRVKVYYSDSVDIFDGNVYINDVNGIKGKNVIIVSSPGVTITETKR